MKHTATLSLFFLSVLLSWGSGNPSSEQYRKITLENGLKVLLLSDSKLNKSSASMSVGVGSLEDRAARPGLAHFLEHMLFLGTEKYPDEAEYGNYLKSNGGYSNAYTSSDHTNYHFEVNHQAFAGALDRFAQFFIAPLFSETYTNRELNAVHSEHQKNLENDDWRMHQLVRSHFNPEHSENHFSTGNRDTLEGITPDEFKSFYKKYYSANQMALAVCGKASLDQLESLVRQHFAAVPKRVRERLRYASDLLEEKEAFRLIQMSPIKDIRELNLVFPAPALQQHYKSKPGRILSYILGFEGEGSLLSYLKSKNLATALSASSWPSSQDYSKFVVSVHLTPKGLKEYKTVIQLFFAYIDIARTKGYPENVFDERATMATLEERYADKGEGADRAVALANQLLEYPIEDAERIPYIYTEKNPAAYNQLLSYIRPNNMLALLAAKGVKTDQVEPHYQTPYSYNEYTGAAYENLQTNISTNTSELFIPKPNPFIPSNLDLIPEVPVRIVNDDTRSLYFLQDTTFSRPKVSLIYQITQPQASISLKNTVLKKYYDACLEEILNETSYTAAMAGLNYNLTAATEKVLFSVNGYHDSAFKFYKQIVDHLTHIDLDAERFLAIKDRILRDLQNHSKLDAWRLARTYQRQLRYEYYYVPKEQLSVAESITLKDVQDFGKTLYTKGKIEGLVYGNYTTDDAMASLEYLQDALGIEALDEASPYRMRLRTPAPGSSVLDLHALEVNNSCFWREYDIGENTPINRVAALALGNIMSNPFYAEMRTRQQLGYIVWGQSNPVFNRLYAFFIIQSNAYAPDVLEQRTVEFLNSLKPLLEALSDEQFQQIKMGVKAKLEEKDKSIAEKANRLFQLAYQYNEDWNRKEEAIKALDSLSAQNILELIHRITESNKAASTTVWMKGRDHEIATPQKSSFKDVDQWKRKQRFE